MPKQRTQAQWDSLKPRYRARLIRAGITRDEYLSGCSLAAARGHAQTPERPARAEKHPDQYPEYVRKLRERAVSPERRQRTYDRLYDEFVQLIADRELRRFDATLLEFNIFQANARLFTRMESMSAREWRVMASGSYTGDDWDNTVSFEGIQINNPFWYHPTG